MCKSHRAWSIVYENYTIVRLISIKSLLLRSELKTLNDACDCNVKDKQHNVASVLLFDYASGFHL